VPLARVTEGSERRLDLPPYPTGWFALAFSTELARGQMVRARFFGRELVLFRGKGGRAVAMDAYCPHMGAHMGYGGRVEGDALRCPFHGFCFDAEGACVSTPYGKGPPKTQAEVWPVLERNGAIFTWYDEAGREPLWDLPPVDFEGFEPLRHKVWERLASHPQETTENSVDFGHLSVVHGYQDVTMEKPLRTEGPYLTATYGMTRRNPLLPTMPPIRASFEIHVHGLGYSYVHVLVPDQGLEGHHFVFPTPVDGRFIQLRAAVAIKAPEPGRVAKPLALLPRAVSMRIISEMALKAYTHDIEQDFDIWENKRYLQPPALADGDGPVGPYRKWCKQFYP
jgi:nitrite reductase/ring-hydroxylating ferredoxin subunit